VQNVLNARVQNFTCSFFCGKKLSVKAAKHWTPRKFPAIRYYPCCMSPLWVPKHIPYVALSSFFNRYKKYTHNENANLPAIPHPWRKQWNAWLALLNDKFNRKVLQLLWRCVHVRRLDLEYFVRIWSTWTDSVKLTILQNYSRNGHACASSQCQAAFSPPTQPGNDRSRLLLQWL